MSLNRTPAVVAALVLVLAVVAPTAAAAESALDVGVEQDETGEVTITVDDNGTAVENASIDVAATDGNYSAAGEYETGANGTVTLAAPDEPVTVDVTATDANLSASTTADLEVPALNVTVDQSVDGNATVTVTYAITGGPTDGAIVNVSTVDENATYAGTGQHTTDANGTTRLPAPDDPVWIEIGASSGELDGSATVELRNVTATDDGGADSFGARVSAFVHSLLGDRGDEPGIGRMVAAWVLDNNPGNAPDHAGPNQGNAPDHAGSGSGNVSDHAGPPHDNPGGPDFASNREDPRGNETAAQGQSGNGQRGPPGDPGSNGNGEAKGKPW